jgi:hypothetical protein
MFAPSQPMAIRAVGIWPSMTRIGNKIDPGPESLLTLRCKTLTSHLGPVFQDDLINDLSANNASPSEILIGAIKELLIGHQTIASVTSHHRSISYLLAPFILNIGIGPQKFNDNSFCLIEAEVSKEGD